MSAGADRHPAALRIVLLLAGAAALAGGLYGRFKGIGTWPLGVDEFYLSRSIDNVLRTGLPGFPCGGYYTRGLLYQYVVAAFRLTGWSPELAGRFVAAVSSLSVLPAVYLLARRVQGSLAGCLTVIILGVSVWEIEMARFARMYAPFQAVFAWYLLAYLGFTLDKRASALRWMVVLSLLGILTWEGGVLVGFANIYAVLLSRRGGRLEARDWRRIAWLGLFLAVLFLATRDLRGFTYPPPTAADVPEPPSGPLYLAAAWLAPVWRHPLWLCLLPVPVGLMIPALRWAAGFRDRRLLFGGLCLALAAAALHAFLVTAAVILLLLLGRLVDRRVLGGRQARYFWLAIAGLLLFWAAAGAFTGEFSPAGSAAAPLGSSIAAVLQRLFDFPDVYNQMLRPWIRTVPILSLMLAAAFVHSCVREILADREELSPAAVLLSLVIVLVLVVGLIPTGRIETRYTFFLYPVLLLLGVSSVLSIAGRLRWPRPVPLALAACAVLLCFALTEDFQPRHVLEVDSERVNFRVGMPRHWAEHYYPRNDIRAAAEWLSAHRQPGDVVIAGIPSLDQYYRQIDYFFLDEADPRYETYVCRDERTERWTNRPLAYTAAALTPIVASGHRIYASLYTDAERSLEARAAAAGWSVERVWTARSGTATVISITAASNAPRGR